MIESVDETAIYEELTELRHHLHTRPELSGLEFETAGLIGRRLSALSPDLLLRNLGGTGVAAVFDSGRPGPSVLFRSELDALPIEEVNDFEYRSRHQNVSHKCGHDGHMAILLGLAYQIARHRPNRGKVIVLFQPAEETGEGAMEVLRDPAFEQIRPDYAFALHNLPGYPLGAVVVKDGPFTAGVRSLIIRLQGMTSHAAEPEHGVNPAEAIADLLYLARDWTVADLSRPDFQLLTPVHVHMGEKAYGVSAGYGEVHLTIRCWSSEAMEKLSSRLLREAADIAGRYGLELETEWTNVFFANHNDPKSVELIRRAARSLDLPLVERADPLKWGEDFGAFSQRFKGAMFGLGAGEDASALHNPDYDFPDELIETGARMFFRIASSLLSE